MDRQSLLRDFFGTFEERFDKKLYSYLGHDAKERPEHMRKTFKQLESDENIPSFDFYCRALEDYIEEYNNEPHHGNGMENKSPNTVYDENRPDNIRYIENELMLRLICGKTVERKVNSNGINLYCNTFIDKDGKLYAYKGKTVKVRYDPDNMESVYIFDIDGRMICEAAAKQHSPFRSVTEEDYIAAGKERKKVRKILNDYRPKKLKNESEYLFGNIAEEYKAKQALTEDRENAGGSLTEITVSDSEKPAKRISIFSQMHDEYKKESG